MNGVNIRNRNCEVIDSLGFGQVVTRVSDNPVNVNCKVGNKNLVMINYKNFMGGTYDTDNSYVAVDYLDPIIDSGKIYDSTKVGVITGKFGANLRDTTSCSRVMTLPNGTRTEAQQFGGGAGLPVCQVGSEFYLMNSVDYKGKTYFVADILIDNI